MSQLLTAPVAKVPWVVREPSNQALMDSRFGKEVLSSEDKKKTAINLKLYSLINESFFPLYLPGRYHSMDCAALKSMTKVEGHYWTHASHFLISSQLHGVYFWRLTAGFSSSRTLFKQLDSLPFFSNKKKSEMFNNGLELCTTSAEFLLNPWVLLQLQWNPVLLLQWTAGVLVEFYTFRLELVELYRWYLPQNLTLTTVKKLFKLLKLFHVNAYRMISYLKVHFESFSEQYGCQVTSDIMNLVNHGIVPLLEFVTSGKACDIVRALKRMSFGSNYRSNVDNYTACFVHYEWESTYNCMFSDHFWHQGKYENLFGPSSSEEVDPSLITDGFRFLLASEVFIESATPEWISEMETKHGKAIETAKLFGLFEPMISKGIITNFREQDLWKCIELYKTYFTHCYYRLMELTLLDGGLRDEDAGVLYDILYLRTRYKIADVQCAMLTKFASFCYEELDCINVQLNAVNAEGLEMSMRQIIKIIDETSARQEKNKLSCWKDFINKVPGSCRGKVNRMEECPSLAKEGAEKVAVIFEDRIKRLVFNAIKDHQNWSENKIEIHPDQPFVQYILPCFVASLLEFADNDDVEQKDKENYVKIVHELIKDSEVHPYKVASTYQAHVSPYNWANHCLFQVILHWQAELILRGLQIALGSSLKATSVTKILHKNFITVLMGFKKIPHQAVDKSDKLSVSYIVQELWPIQVYRLFGKILKAIGAAVPGSLPDAYEVALELTVTANMQHNGGLRHFWFSSELTVPDGYVKHNDLCFATLFKVENVLGLDTSTMSKYYEPSNAMQPIIFYECKKLSLEQVVALVLYSTMPLTARKGYADNLCKVSVPMDRVEELFFAYRAGDYFKLKLMLGKMFTRDGIDFSVVTYEFAKKVAPYTYRGALEQVKDGRVQMNRSGELTLLPIKHCHWCGLVRDDTLRLCDLCQEEQGYPVRTWFCGDKCEKRAMKLHGEEHARHHYLNLGFESKVRVLEPETEPLKGAEGKKKKKKKSGRAKK